MHRFAFLFAALLIGCNSSSNYTTKSPSVECWNVIGFKDLTVLFDGDCVKQSITKDIKCYGDVIDSQNDTVYITFYGKRSKEWDGIFYPEFKEKPVIKWNRVDTLFVPTGCMVLEIADLKWIMEKASDCCGCKKEN